MNIALIENKLFVLAELTGVDIYDFDFDLHFHCRHPHQIDGNGLCLLRVGAVDDYAAKFTECESMDLRLVNSPAEHERASELELWYPLIKEFTPRTLICERLPSADEIEAHFHWPVFLKGSRQTSKHNPELAIIRDRSHYQVTCQHYAKDPILHWQKPVIREFIPLAPVVGDAAGMIPPSVEYRSFWWNGACVGWGCYWYRVTPYECTDTEVGLSLAGDVARRLKVPFLVVDFAKTVDGSWVVIECNDAQESGYAGIPPHVLWQNVLHQIGA